MSGVLRYGAVAGVRGASRASGSRAGGAAQSAPDRAARHRAELLTQPAGDSGSQLTMTGHEGGDASLFTRYALDYAGQRSEPPLTVLQAGCTTAGAELDLDALRSSGCAVVVSRVDDDSPVCRAVAGAHPELAGCTLGDLRSVPLAPRSQDIVQCSMLLARISNAELVLGRFVETLKPGGLLLLRVPDIQSAAGFLDRVLPRSLRALIWRAQRPGEPGPHPAVYEPLAAARGIRSFAARHGLVIAGRQLSCGPAQRRPHWLQAACKLVSSVSGGRLDWTHDELCYVIRKPESGFARVL